MKDWPCIWIRSLRVGIRNSHGRIYHHPNGAKYGIYYFFKLIIGYFKIIIISPWPEASSLSFQLFEPHIEAYPGSNNSAAESKGHYLLLPVGGSANYRKLGIGDSRTADKEMQKAVFKLHDVTLSVSQVFVYHITLSLLSVGF